MSARIKGCGSDLPRFSARRSIPAHAVPLKKNRCGIEPVSSTCDNEYTAASLGQSEILGVQGPPSDCARGSIHSTSVRPFSPWRFERCIFSGKPSQKAPEGVVVRREDAGDVFPKDDGGLFASLSSNKVDCISKFHEFESEIAALVTEAFAQPCNAERLARRTTAENVRRLNVAFKDSTSDCRHVPKVCN